MVCNLIKSQHFKNQERKKPHAFDSLTATVYLVIISSGRGVEITLVEAVGVGERLLKGES